MFKARFIAQGSAALFSCLLLSSCSNSQSPLLDFLEASDFDSPVVNLVDVYGSEWIDFALICADAPREYIAEVLELPSEQVSDLEGSEQSGIVYWSGDSVESDLLDPSDAALCNSSTPLASKLTAPTLNFSQGTNGEWLLNNPPVTEPASSQ
ncbi:hypothetical protein N24_2855 [Corynebacterium suranareeae]|uniref:Secreted protein n=1 Tax=Corynebacterium suranareeae TaxID=2506452 RepID=A0A160PS76_9CORY|nr:hypothetical protein [Corynebacterium suranareeae]BAU97117.1 hypothetical protein N24_2855 [Corynebacterium suranareeae]